MNDEITYFSCRFVNQITPGSFNFTMQTVLANMNKAYLRFMSIVPVCVGAGSSEIEPCQASLHLFNAARMVQGFVTTAQPNSDIGIFVSCNDRQAFQGRMMISNWQGIQGVCYYAPNYRQITAGDSFELHILLGVEYQND